MDYIKKHWKDILLTLMFFSIIALIMSTTCANNKLDVAENNIKALNDTVHEYKLKNGELMYEKQGFILEKQELEKYLDISKKEVSELEKKLGSALATISKLKAEIHVDTIKMIDSVYIDTDSIYKNNFKYKDDWISISGLSTFEFDPFSAYTTINNISLNASLKVGMTKDNKWFATTDNPYLHFTSIEGANMDSHKQNRWSLSFQFGVGGLIGYGICIPPTGGIINSGIIVGAGFYGGLGISYKILDF